MLAQAVAPMTNRRRLAQSILRWVPDLRPHDLSTFFELGL